MPPKVPDADLRHLTATQRLLLYVHQRSGCQHPAGDSTAERESSYCLLQKVTVTAQLALRTNQSFGPVALNEKSER